MARPNRSTWGNYGKTFNFLAFEYGVERRVIAGFEMSSALYSSLAQQSLYVTFVFKGMRQESVMRCVLITTSLLKQLLRVLAVAPGLTVLMLPAMAQESSSDTYQELAKAWIGKTLPVAASADGAKLRMEVTVGHLDNRLKLAPCGNVEPYLPVGARLWGKAYVGLRCIDGMSRWNVSLPVTVNAFGPAWVIKNPILSGVVVTAADVVLSEVNWAEETNAVLKDRALWEGQIATRPLTTGQTLRQGMVKPAQVFQAGAPIRVVAQGTGFQVSSDAQALSVGVVGQLARVRMENGRVTTGIVLDTNTVKIDL